MQGLLEVARSVLSDLDLDEVLKRVLAAARELTGARYAALGVLNDDKTGLARFLTDGVGEAERAAIGSLPRGRGVLGALIDDPVPLRLVDVGEHPRSYGFPPGHPPMHTFLGVPVLVDGVPFGNLYLTEKAGGRQFDDADEEALVVLADFAGVAIDHASRYTGTKRDRDALARTVAALEASTQIARALGGETDPDVVLRLVAERGRALVSARTLVIELVQGDRLEIAAGAGEVQDGLIGARVDLEQTVAAHAMRTHTVQRLDEEPTRSRFDEYGLGSLGVYAAGGIVVPLIFRGESQGVLVALDRLAGGPGFSSDDEVLLQSFASSAATAVATARSVTAERQRQRLAAAEAERRRWARELHDDTLQGLGAVRLALTAARRGGSSELDSAVGVAIEQLEETISDLQALITDLRSAALDELGLRAAIEALAERSIRHGLATDVSVDLGGGERLPDEVEIAVYRIVQEALANAAKHGAAKRAVVEIAAGADVHIVVRDDGSGFDPDTPSTGFGLVGMRERVALLDGELLVESGAGGTRITATIAADPGKAAALRGRARIS